MIENNPSHEPLDSRKRMTLLDDLVSNLIEFAVFLLDRKGTFLTWHPGVEHQFGYSADEFIGRNFEILFPAESRQSGDPETEIETAVTSGKSTDTRWLIRKDGQRIHVDGILLSLEANADGPAVLAKVISNVTARKNTEENLRALTHALDYSMVLVRRWDGGLTHWTRGCEHLYGWTSLEANGQPVHKLLKTSFPQPLEEILQQLQRDGVWRGELHCVHRDGTPLFVSAHWALLRDSSGDPLSIIETNTDITQRSQTERELEEANARFQAMTLELERSNSELEEFARIASHDLSAPIVSTRWLVDLVAKQQAEHFDANGRECIAQIQDNLDRMTALIDAVLSHAKAGRDPASLSAASGESALAEAVKNLERDIELSGATITFDPLPEVRIHAHALQQLFQNVLSNAIKYRRPGVPPAIHISAARRQNMFLFRVEDNGLGIEEQWLERIFLPMQRLHGREIPGSGIGLATCKKIVRRVGGEIWVESTPGSGSRVFFSIPAAGTDKPEK